MSIRFRADRNKYEVEVSVNGKRISRLFKTKKDAKTFADTVGLQKLLGISGMNQPLTIESAFQEFLSTTSSFKTPSGKRADIRFFAFAQHFFEKERGLRTIDQIKVVDLELFILWLARPQKVGTLSKPVWSGRTVAKCVKLVKAVLRKLFAHERITKNTGDHVKVPRGTITKRRAMTAHEFQIIFEAAPNWYQPILAFLRLTGARPSSVAYLKWSDVDFSTATLLLSSRKGGLDKLKMIPIPMFPELWELLSRLKNVGTFDNRGHVFFDQRGRPITARNISKRGERLIKACGLSGVVLYGLRHALAVDMTRAGVSLELIRQTFGHSSLAQTSEYAESIGSDSVREALKLVRGGKK